MDHSPFDTTGNGYVMPTESAVETARLVLQGQALTQAMGGLLPSVEQTSIAHMQQVLDLACGPGEWVLAVAQRYPHLQVVGVDLSHHSIE